MCPVKRGSTVCHLFIVVSFCSNEISGNGNAITCHAVTSYDQITMHCFPILN